MSMELRIYGRKQTDNLLYVQDYSRLILEGQIYGSFSQLAYYPLSTVNYDQFFPISF